MMFGDHSVETVDRFEIDDELLEVFSGEAEDLLTKIFASLASIIAGQDASESLWELRRTAHTLKGAAGAVGLDAVAELAHLFEDSIEEYSRSADGDICLLTDIAAALPISIHQHPDQVREIISVFRPRIGGPPQSHKVSPATALPLDRKLSSTNPSSVARVSLLKVDRCAELSSLLCSHRSTSASHLSTLRAQSSELRSNLSALAELLRRFDPAEAEKTIREAFVIGSSLERLADEMECRAEISHRTTEELRGLLDSMRDICFGTIEPRLRGAIRAAADDAGTKCEFEIENGDVEIDTVLLAEMAEPILHILRNAAVHGIEPPDERAVKGKSATGRIVLNIERTAGLYQIKIIDDGKGIDVHALKQKAVASGAVSIREAKGLAGSDAFSLIFLDGLSTAKSVGFTAGRGVGMRIVKESVESRGGSVKVESEQNVGTVFTLTLPIDARTNSISTGSGITERAAGDGKVVLIVDDSASVRFAASSILTSGGWDVIAAENALSAIEILQKLDRPPDVIVSDVEMPHMSGLQFLRCLKDEAKYSSVPVLICSSRNDSECIEEARKFGAADYLTKPFSADVLKNRVERAVS